MKTLYLECTMGAAGDMLTAALLELMPDRAAALARINALGIPGVHVHADPATVCGLVGTGEGRVVGLALDAEVGLRVGVYLHDVVSGGDGGLDGGLEQRIGLFHT